VEIIDVTRTVDPKMLKWPDETEPPSQEFVTRTDDGDPATVSEWKMSSHTGTHMDARMHFIPGGWTMEALDLSRSVGSCRVVDLTHVEGHVGRDDLEAAEVAGQVRLLLKTRNSEQEFMHREEFEEVYSAISREAAEYLVEIGVETIGVDYLSVEPFEDGEFNTHHTLLGADVVILEGLVLTEVEPGEYFLACLPLKLAGSDGSPARAILVRDL
jgi:arylformamidase